MSTITAALPPANDFEAKQQQFIAFCDTLTKGLNNFWPRQAEVHKRNEIERAQDPENPLRSLSEAEYTHLSSLSPEKRRLMGWSRKGEDRISKACVELNRRLDPRYCVADHQNDYIADHSLADRCALQEKTKHSAQYSNAVAAWNSDRTLGWRYNYAEMSRLLELLKKLARLYMCSDFPSFETFSVARGEQWQEINVRTRWAMLKVIKTAFLTFCDMEPVPNRPGVYVYPRKMTTSRFRIAAGVDHELHCVLNYVSFANTVGGHKTVTYEVLEGEIAQLQPRRPNDFKTPFEWEHPFSELALAPEQGLYTMLDGGFLADWKG